MGYPADGYYFDEARLYSNMATTRRIVKQKVEMDIA